MSDAVEEMQRTGYAPGDEESFRQIVRQRKPTGDGPLADDDPYLQMARSLEKTLPGADVPWLAKLREKGRERYRTLGWPTTDVEEWKYTSLKPVRRLDTEPVAADGAGDVARSDLAPYVFDDLDAHQLVFVDGHLDADLSDVGDLPDGVTVASLAEVLDERPETVEPSLGAYVDIDEHAIPALNTATFQDGAYVHVEDGVVAETAIHVLHVTTDRGEPHYAAPRNLFVVGENAQARVVETYAGLSEQAYFNNAVTEIVAGDNAHLKHVKMEREGPEGFQLATQHVHQGRTATVRTHNICLGGKRVRTDLYSRLDGEAGNHLMNGLFVLRDEQHVDNHTALDHAEPGCTSHQLYKGILDEASHGVFYGTILCRQKAQQTDADQHNPNILLSEDALVDTTPQLEIFADDVRCTHGSTFGQLPKEQVFYLQARGYEEDVARSLLTYAFAGEVIRDIEIAAVRETVRDLVLERLPRGDLVRDAL